MRFPVSSLNAPCWLGKDSARWRCALPCWVYDKPRGKLVSHRQTNIIRHVLWKKTKHWFKFNWEYLQQLILIPGYSIVAMFFLFNMYLRGETYIYNLPYHMHVALILFFLLIQNLLFPFYRYSFNLYRLKVLLAFSHSLSNQTKIEEFRVSSTNQISWENWTDPLQNSNRKLEVLRYVWKSCRTKIVIR